MIETTAISITLSTIFVPYVHYLPSHFFLFLIIFLSPISQAKKASELHTLFTHYQYSYFNLLCPSSISSLISYFTGKKSVRVTHSLHPAASMPAADAVQQVREGESRHPDDPGGGHGEVPQRRER